MNGQEYAKEEWDRYLEAKYRAAERLSVDEEPLTPALPPSDPSLLNGTDESRGAVVGLVMLALAFGLGVLVGWLIS